MSTMASQITGISIACPAVVSGTDQRKHQSSTALAFVWGIHWWLLNSQHKWPVTRKMFPFDDVIMHFEIRVLSMSHLMGLAWFRYNVSYHNHHVISKKFCLAYILWCYYQSGLLGGFMKVEVMVERWRLPEYEPHYSGRSVYYLNSAGGVSKHLGAL